MRLKKQINADRFSGVANIYDIARPQCPSYIMDIAGKYLGSKPEFVVDLGCGTGLSTFVWADVSKRTVGVEPNEDMLRVAREKAGDSKSVEFVQGYADNIKLEDACADVVTCSQAFHWMEPQSTLREIDRILKPGGIFLAYDCDWLPVCNLKAEMAYLKLVRKIDEIESATPAIRDAFIYWNKDRHLIHIKNSGHFSFAREIVFANRERCSAKRLIALAFSQGSMQAVLKVQPDAIMQPLREFETEINNIFKEEQFDADFCYRVRIGVK